MQKQTARTSEFNAALAQVASERGLDPQVVMETIKQAILAAFKKDHPDQYNEEGEYDVTLDIVSGEAHIFEIKGKKKTDITPPGFGRIAAQTAKQVILQRVREAEKTNILGEYEKRMGTLVNGMILRFAGSEIVVDIGKTEAIMPVSEQTPSENYRINAKMMFYMDSIRDGFKGREVVVSRAHPNLISELFKREVPEVNSGSVVIKAIARDAGIRTKIAVWSNQNGVDPVGSCVGQKGVRVQAVISEVNGEKIDIIPYSENSEQFVANALAPAAGAVVKIDTKKGIADVTVPDDQLSLAIGRDGQNAKLAGKLTGFHINVKSVTTNDQ
ncbi:MAG: transcription termination factor NusA [Candidatus Amesbacteria bacterium]|nr:transcription termination factor NusA [Candidatus Amesbacteria bacterium]